MSSKGIVKTEQVQNWLGQFALGDRYLAEQMLDEMVLVSRDDFHDHLRELILCEATKVDGTVALYTERELRHYKGVPNRLFINEPMKRPRRVEGAAGPQSIKATKAYDQSVGSEGLVANLVTELNRDAPDKFLINPGPDQIRKQKVRAFWIVTDLVGSGKRALSYLEAAWRVHSVTSWWSRKLINFGIFAYASTALGASRVKQHPCRPRLFQVMPCPTIDSAFPEKLAAKVKNLCEVYDPVKDDPSKTPWGGPSSLGWWNIGALMVFAHGAPNNVPMLLHKKSKRKKHPWTPLFPSRVTAGLPSVHFGVRLSAEKIQRRLSKMGRSGLTRAAIALEDNVDAGEVLLLLGALSRPPRMNETVLSNRSGLPCMKVLNLCKKLMSYGWIDSQRRLTDAGRGQVRYARLRAERQLQGLPPTECIDQIPYYPKSLRHPV